LIKDLLLIFFLYILNDMTYSAIRYWLCVSEMNEYWKRLKI